VRNALQLPATPASQVTLVTDQSVCRKANTAFANEFSSQGSGLSGRVYVVSVASVYAVVDPVFLYDSVSRGRLWAFVFIIDSKFKKLSILAP
jgi:hypothetical protein